MPDLARTPRQLGNLVRRARKKRGLSQTQLGDVAGLRQETISLIETGNPAAKLQTSPSRAARPRTRTPNRPALQAVLQRHREHLLMARRRQHAPLCVLVNNRLIGHLGKEASGAIYFRYDESWLGWEHALSVSLSLPLREDTYRGAPVAAVFENLLPDSDALRIRVAEQVGAEGIDAYSMLAAIGHDCVGALQFVADGETAATPAPSSARPSTIRPSNNCSAILREHRWATP